MLGKSVLIATDWVQIPSSLVFLLVTATGWHMICGWYCMWVWMTIMSQDSLMTTKENMGGWYCNLSAQAFPLLFSRALFCGRLLWNFVCFGALCLAVTYFPGLPV